MKENTKIFSIGLSVRQGVNMAHTDTGIQNLHMRIFHSGWQKLSRYKNSRGARIWVWKSIVSVLFINFKSKICDIHSIFVLSFPAFLPMSRGCFLMINLKGNDSCQGINQGFVDLHKLDVTSNHGLAVITEKNSWRWIICLLLNRLISAWLDCEVAIKILTKDTSFLHLLVVTLCIVDLPGECGRCTTAGQKPLWGLHWETSWSDRRLSWTRHLRRILWLERLSTTYRYCVPHSLRASESACCPCDKTWDMSEMMRGNHPRQAVTDPIVAEISLQHENLTYLVWSVLLWFSYVMCGVRLFDGLL